MRSLRRAAASSGVRVSRRPSRADRRRTALGAGMLVGRRGRRRGGRAVRCARRRTRCAALERRTRARRSSSAVSPLAEYRSLFADARADDILFTVTSRRGAPRARPAGHARQLRRRDLPQRRRGRARSGAASSACRRRWMPAAGARSTPRSRSSSSTGSGCRPSAGSHRSTSRATARPRSPIGSTTARTRARACRPRAADSTPGDAYAFAAVEPAMPDLASIEAPGGARRRRPQRPTACARGSTSTRRARAARPWPGS